MATVTLRDSRKSPANPSAGVLRNVASTDFAPVHSVQDPTDQAMN
eukprot:CAMPEP_0171161132 /NCGR_PEP_ID=MMETSP0790-20130122/3915_1 /TAXON_ID=2925 /ORGANISM="Alexandrium catenella, Strain OF101" /LENGTH=44 /DNA_ID= /DNA_START= /DNA_END= /DNA_ORIENTATION=